MHEMSLLSMLYIGRQTNMRCHGKNIMSELNQAIIVLVISNRHELKKDIVFEETEPQIKRKSNHDILF